MDLNHEFIVNVPINDAWVILTTDAISGVCVD